MPRLAILTLILGVYLTTIPGGPTTSESWNAAPVAGLLIGRVVDPRNVPIRGVQVQVPGRAAVLTSREGEFRLEDLAATERLTVSFSAHGFMNTTKICFYVTLQHLFKTCVVPIRSFSPEVKICFSRE